jgi:hypothetical protein
VNEMYRKEKPNHSYMDMLPLFPTILVSFH